ncbi:MAG: AAA family ATPase [Ignavibacteriales bacterium]|nr:AAA family ATPase [Ignavibacteriales bacterium]
MDKSIVFAVAGSGKTFLIVDQLDESKRSVVITYTNNNFSNLQNKIIKKFGYFPTNIKLYTFFTFVHSFCYKPYLLLESNTKGISFKPNPNKYSVGTSRYINKSGKLYFNRITKFLELNNLYGVINSRIEKYFDNLFIDEIQDLAGNDFNFLKCISKANLNILFVGDFYQHTFDTSRDGNVNSRLHENYADYQNQFKRMNFNVDLNSLKKSYRCTNSVCNFVTNNLGIEIESHKTADSKVIIIVKEEDAKEVFYSNEIVKMFYQQHYAYNCQSVNWGDSKGIDHYNDVCVILNKKSENKFNAGKLNELSQMVKNKLYVACTRARENLYVLPVSLIDDSFCK